MLRLLAGLDFASYNPRTYIISSDDTLSLTKVAELEAAKANETALDEVTGPPVCARSFLPIGAGMPGKTAMRDAHRCEDTQAYPFLSSCMPPSLPEFGAC